MGLNLAREEKEELAVLLGEKQRRDSRRRLFSLYPETGSLRRELYPKHMRFFEEGATKKIRGFSAAHRIGKTWGTGGFECVLHATGLYPSWWKGKRFDRPTKIWAAGDTNQTTKDIIQEKLFGTLGEPGTGLIPGDKIIDFKRKATSVADTLETIFVRHISGGVSSIGLKSYEQGKQAFYGTEMDVILLDEEPPLDVYVQCLIRTMTTQGIVMLTFTPLKGMSDVVKSLFPGGQSLTGESTSKIVIMATWDDAPHLTEEDKVILRANIPPHLLDAMTKGIPSLGSGAIYPIAVEKLLVEDFPIPVHWPRGYGFDVGWNCTAALWGALDQESDVFYLYSEHKMGEALPLIHTEAIKARGEWIKGAADPASMGSAQKDGEKLFESYTKLGLKLILADNAVEAGIFDVWLEMSRGKLKVFKSLVHWQEEFGFYQRDDKGKVVKKDDHLMDCMRYLRRTWGQVASRMPVDEALKKKLTIFGEQVKPKEESWLYFGLGNN